MDELLMQERDRKVKAVMNLPVEQLRDLATLAIGLVYRQLEFMEQNKDKDAVAAFYALRIMQLADGEYGIGGGFNSDGRMCDTSTVALLHDLRAK